MVVCTIRVVSLKMRPEPGNVEGKVVRSHEFSHAVKHEVNWSHFLFALVALVAILKLGPALAPDRGEGE